MPEYVYVCMAEISKWNAPMYHYIVHVQTTSQTFPCVWASKSLSKSLFVKSYYSKLAKTVMEFTISYFKDRSYTHRLCGSCDPVI